MTAPFAPGSLSLRLYPHLDRAAPEIVDEVCAQAALAVECGFDGVMTSEHHGGFAGYLPNPLQTAGWCLAAMPKGWAAPCPLLLPLRPVALVAEEVAWLAARFPGRVGVGVAAGALPSDFTIMDTTLDDLTERYTRGLETLARLLTHGDPDGPLAADPAIAACAEQPIPVVSAAASATAARRAARLGTGIILDSLSTLTRCRALTDAYRDAGGAGPCILVRRAFVGAAPQAALDSQVAVYRGYASSGAQQHWDADAAISGPAPEAVADGVLAALRGSGCDVLNLRVHVPGVPARVVRDQIERLATDVLPLIRAGVGLA